MGRSTWYITTDGGWRTDEADDVDGGEPWDVSVTT